MNWNKLKEPSTWRGLALMAGLFGFYVDPASVEAIGTGVAAAIGVIEVVRAEHKPEA